MTIHIINHQQHLFPNGHFMDISFYGSDILHVITQFGDSARHVIERFAFGEQHLKCVASGYLRQFEFSFDKRHRAVVFCDV